MEALYIILIVIGALLVLYLLMILPRGKAPKMQTILCTYAHRGLHDEEIPENSLAAFERACVAGHGIELDVQLSRDGVVVVFHDSTLTRMCGVDKRVADCTLEELKSYSLLGTNESIPTFAEVLSLVAGRVPLLVELKGENTDSSLCAPVRELLAAYDGVYCIESFNPILLFQMRREMPEGYYGLLYTNVCREKKKCSLVNILVTLMALNFLAKPNFIAYDKNVRTSPLVWFTTRLCCCRKFVYTIRGREEYDTSLALGECPIFEALK